jgi:hypothetical protein
VLQGLLKEKDVREVVELIASQSSSVSPAVFDTLRERALEVLMTEHLIAFKKSAEKDKLGTELNQRQERLQVRRGWA